MPKRRRAFLNPHVNGLRQEERGHPNGKINGRGVGMWLLYWRSMFCVFSHTGHAFIGTDQPRLPAYLSLEIRIYTQARAWTVVEFEFSSAAPQAKPKVNDVRYNRWRCTTERHTQKKRNLGLWDKWYVITPSVNLYLPLSGHLDCVLLVHDANKPYISNLLHLYRVQDMRLRGRPISPRPKTESEKREAL